MKSSVHTFPYSSNKKSCYGEMILSTVSDAVIAVDLDLVICSWNRAAEEIYGWKKEDTIGKSFVDFFLPETLEQIFGNGFARLLGTKPWSIETTHVTKDNRAIFVHCSVNAMKGRQGNLSGFVTVNRDMTKRKEAENELKRQNKILEAIAWTQAHKVRSPVATILGLTQILNRKDASDPFNIEVIENIRKVAVQLDLVIHEIVSKSQPGLTDNTVMPGEDRSINGWHH